MKILLFGKNGQVGWELNRSLQPLGEVVALGRREADFSDPGSLRDILQSTRPDVIVNAVAYTAVDKAEDEEDLADLVNSVAPGIIAEEALKNDALLIHYSTDYVFDGTKTSTYNEADEPNPLNAYGRTKLAGERAIMSSGCDFLILRTSWVYASRGNNFLLTILKLAGERNELSIVADQTGSPTSARSIADATALCIHQAHERRRSEDFSSGLYHLTSSNCTSWHGFSEEIIKIARCMPGIELKVKTIKKIPSDQYPTPAKRPMYSCCSNAKIEKTFNIRLPDWKQSLRLCMEELSG